MPNGGSDCCGTCWFNSKNDGDPGYHGAEKEGTVLCMIRDIKIDNPFYTYCINHPHHNPNKVDVPLGAVYTGEERSLLHKAPRNEKTRLALLHLVESMNEIPLEEYPFGSGLDEEIIIQLGNLQEKRSIPFLKRILEFEPFAQPKGKNPFNRNRVITVGLALESIGKIDADDSIEVFEKYIYYGLELIRKKDYDPKEDKYAAIRYHTVRALNYCKSMKALELLKESLKDPHQEIKAFSKNTLEKKLGFEEVRKILENEEKEFIENKEYEEYKKDKWWEFWKKNKK